MQKRLHNFMDKMQEKSVEERRKLLFSSMVFFGILISLIGVTNIFSNLVALNVTDSSSNLASPVESREELPAESQ